MLRVELPQISSGIGVSRNTIEVSLATLDEIGHQLKRQGKDIDSLQIMEKALGLRRETYGDSHPETQKLYEALALRCNVVAMKLLKHDNFKACEELLKRAESLIDEEFHFHSEMSRLKLKATTCNNIGCFYRRKGKLHASLHYLEQALAIEQSSDFTDNPAATHLNLCAVLSQMGRHLAAMDHAKAALVLLEAAASKTSPPPPPARRPAPSSPPSGDQMAEGTATEPKEVAAKKPSELSMLAIAYHNLAVEKEFLKDLEGACDSYGKAIEAAEKDLGPDHPTTASIRSSYQQALKAKKPKSARRQASVDSARRSTTTNQQEPTPTSLPTPGRGVTPRTLNRQSTEVPTRPSPVSAVAEPPRPEPSPRQKTPRSRSRSPPKEEHLQRLLRGVPSRDTSYTTVSNRGLPPVAAESDSQIELSDGISQQPYSARPTPRGTANRAPVPRPAGLPLKQAFGDQQQQSESRPATSSILPPLVLPSPSSSSEAPAAMISERKRTSSKRREQEPVSTRGLPKERRVPRSASRDFTESDTDTASALDVDAPPRPMTERSAARKQLQSQGELSIDDLPSSSGGYKVSKKESHKSRDLSMYEQPIKRPNTQQQRSSYQPPSNSTARPPVVPPLPISASMPQAPMTPASPLGGYFYTNTPIGNPQTGFIDTPVSIPMQVYDSAYMTSPFEPQSYFAQQPPMFPAAPQSPLATGRPLNAFSPPASPTRAYSPTRPIVMNVPYQDPMTGMVVFRPQAFVPVPVAPPSAPYGNPAPADSPVMFMENAPQTPVMLRQHPVSKQPPTHEQQQQQQSAAAGSSLTAPKPQPAMADPNVIPTSPKRDEAVESPTHHQLSPFSSLANLRKPVAPAATQTLSSQEESVNTDTEKSLKSPRPPKAPRGEHTVTTGGRPIAKSTKVPSSVSSSQESATESVSSNTNGPIPSAQSPRRSGRKEQPPTTTTSTANKPSSPPNDALVRQFATAASEGAPIPFDALVEYLNSRGLVITSDPNRSQPSAAAVAATNSPTLSSSSLRGSQEQQQPVSLSLNPALSASTQGLLASDDNKRKLFSRILRIGASLEQLQKQVLSADGVDEHEMEALKSMVASLGKVVSPEPPTSEEESVVESKPVAKSASPAVDQPPKKDLQPVKPAQPRPPPSGGPRSSRPVPRTLSQQMVTEATAPAVPPSPEIEQPVVNDKAEQERKEKEAAAAVKIQSAERGRQARKQTTTMREQDAIKLQQKSKARLSVYHCCVANALGNFCTCDSDKKVDEPSKPDKASAAEPQSDAPSEPAQVVQEEEEEQEETPEQEKARRELLENLEIRRKSVHAIVPTEKIEDTPIEVPAHEELKSWSFPLSPSAARGDLGQFNFPGPEEAIKVEPLPIPSSQHQQPSSSPAETISIVAKLEPCCVANALGNACTCAQKRAEEEERKKAEAEAEAEAKRKQEAEAVAKAAKEKAELEAKKRAEEEEVKKAQQEEEKRQQKAAVRIQSAERGRQARKQTDAMRHQPPTKPEPHSCCMGKALGNACSCAAKAPSPQVVVVEQAPPPPPPKQSQPSPTATAPTIDFSNFTFGSNAESDQEEGIDYDMTFAEFAFPPKAPPKRSAVPSRPALAVGHNVHGDSHVRFSRGVAVLPSPQFVEQTQPPATQTQPEIAQQQQQSVPAPLPPAPPTAVTEEPTPSQPPAEAESVATVMTTPAKKKSVGFGSLPSAEPPKAVNVEEEDEEDFEVPPPTPMRKGLMRHRDSVSVAKSHKMGYQNHHDHHDSDEETSDNQKQPTHEPTETLKAFAREQEQAAVKIQAATRGRQARKEVATMRQEQSLKSVAIVEQQQQPEKKVEDSLPATTTKPEISEEKTATTKIETETSAPAEQHDKPTAANNKKKKVHVPSKSEGLSLIDSLINDSITKVEERQHHHDHPDEEPTPPPVAAKKSAEQPQPAKKPAIKLPSKNEGLSFIDSLINDSIAKVEEREHHHDVEDKPSAETASHAATPTEIKSAVQDPPKEIETKQREEEEEANKRLQQQLEEREKQIAAEEQQRKQAELEAAAAKEEKRRAEVEERRKAASALAERKRKELEAKHRAEREAEEQRRKEAEEEKLKREREEREKAAIKIQSVERGRQARKQTAEIINQSKQQPESAQPAQPEPEKTATATIPRRPSRIPKIVVDETPYVVPEEWGSAHEPTQEEKERAAIKIQSAERGRRARKEFANLKQNLCVPDDFEAQVQPACQIPDEPEMAQSTTTESAKSASVAQPQQPAQGVDKEKEEEEKRKREELEAAEAKRAQEALLAAEAAARKRAEEEAERKEREKAAVKIQSVERGRQARKQASELAELEAKRKAEEEKERQEAEARKRAAEEQKRNAELEALRKEAEEAEQRKLAEAKKREEEALAREQAASKIQAVERGRQARKQTEVEFESKRAEQKAAEEAKLRAEEEARKQQEEHEREIAAIKIQSVERGRQARKQQAEESAQKKARELEEERLRQELETKREEERKKEAEALRAAEQEREREQAATKIQAAERGRQARKQVEIELEAKRKAEIEARKAEEQRRKEAEEEKLKREREERELAAIKIQSVERGRQARKQTAATIAAAEEPKNNKVAEVSPQPVAESVPDALDKPKSPESTSTTPTKSSTPEEEREKAAVKIQAVERGRQARKEVAPVPAPTTEAPKKIEEPKSEPAQLPRANTAQTIKEETTKIVQNIIAEEERERATVKIQAVERGRQARKQLENPPPKREQPSPTLPRANTAQTISEETLKIVEHVITANLLDVAEDPKPVSVKPASTATAEKEREKAAVKIQAVERGRQARKQISSEKTKPTLAEELSAPVVLTLSPPTQPENNTALPRANTTQTISEETSKIVENVITANKEAPPSRTPSAAIIHQETEKIISHVTLSNSEQAPPVVVDMYEHMNITDIRRVESVFLPSHHNYDGNNNNPSSPSPARLIPSDAFSSVESSMSKFEQSSLMTKPSSPEPIILSTFSGTDAALATYSPETPVKQPSAPKTPAPTPAAATSKPQPRPRSAGIREPALPRANTAQVISEETLKIVEHVIAANTSVPNLNTKVENSGSLPRPDSTATKFVNGVIDESITELTKTQNDKKSGSAKDVTTKAN